MNQWSALRACIEDVDRLDAVVPQSLLQRGVAEMQGREGLLHGGNSGP